MVTFGVVFEYGEHEYVYLAATDQVIWAAKILDREQTQELEKSNAKAAKQGRDRLKPAGYCYVVLSTKEFAARAAHLGFSGNNPGLKPYETGRRLDRVDLTRIKAEILEDHSGVDLKLKELVSDIDV